MVEGWDPPHSIIVVADGDSRVKWAKGLARSIRANLSSPESYGIEVVNLAASDAIEHLFVRSYYDLSKCHFLIMGYGGGANLNFADRFFEFYSEKGGNFRPILIAGFNGICDPMDPHPLLCRSSADLILANSPEDLSKFGAWFSDLGIDATKRLMLAGFFPESQSVVPLESRDVEGRRNRRRIVFFAQPTVPETLKERLYLLQELNKLAVLNPGWDIVVKPRSGRYVRGITHIEKYYYQDIKEQFLRNAPANFVFSNESVDDLLEETDLCVTVGSTVAISAIKREIPTLIISDFGVRRDYGNHHFVGSGYLGSLSSISAHPFRFQSVEPWMNRHIVDSSTHVAAIAQHLEGLVCQQCADRTRLPDPMSIYSALGSSYMTDPRVRPQVSSGQRFFYRLYRLLGDIKNYIFK